MKKMSKKRIKGIVDLTINDDDTFPFASKERNGSNNDFFDLTGEEEPVPYAPPSISQHKRNLAKNHNDAIDLTDDNTESCTLASRPPQPTSTSTSKETLSTSKLTRTAISPTEKASLTGKLTPTLAAQPSNKLLDYNKNSWHNNTTYHSQMSQSEHLDESKRLALILLTSVYKEYPVVNSQKQNKTPFNIDIFTEVPYSGDEKSNYMTLDANNLLKDVDISKRTMTKDSSKCKKRAIKPTIAKKKMKNKNIDFKLEETDTYQKLIQKRIEGNKIDFKKNSYLEGMIIRNGNEEKRAQNNKTVAKLKCKDKKCILKTKKSTFSDFKQTRDESCVTLTSEIQKEVAVVPKSILKLTSTLKEDLKTRIPIKRDSDGYKKSNIAKVTKPRKQITKRQNNENCKKAIQARCSEKRLKDLVKKLKKFNTKITPTYSNENILVEDHSTKKEDENDVIPTTVEIKTSKENVTAISSQERKQFKTLKKVRFSEEISSNKPTSKLKRGFKDKLGNKQKPKRTDNQKSPKTISKNKFSYTATKSYDSSTDKSNVTKIEPRIILSKLLTKPLDNETSVINPTRTRDFASSSSNVDTNGQSNQNTQKSFDHINYNPKVPSKTLNPSIVLNNNETIPIHYESKPELPNTGMKINYPARKSSQHQEVNIEALDLGSFCRNKQTALISKFGLPNSLHHNSTAASDKKKLTSSTNTTKKIQKRTYSLTNNNNTHSDLTKKNLNPQPSSSKQQNSTAPAAVAVGRIMNSKKKQQSQEIPPVVTSENINYNIYNIINTMTQNAFNPTVSNQNTMPQPQSIKQSKNADLANVSAQQANSNKEQSQETLPVIPPHNTSDLISFIKTMTENLLQSSLPNQNFEVKKIHTIPQSYSCKQVNVTSHATALKQSQEQHAVATSNNNKNCTNSFSTLRDSNIDCTLSNQHYKLSNSQPTLSIQSTNTAFKSTPPQQFDLTKKQSEEISPVVNSDDINNNTYSFNTMKHNVSSFTLPKRNDELSNLLPSSSKQFTSAAYSNIAPQQLNSERRQSREIPPVATSYNIENNNNSYNAMKHSAFNSTLSNTPNPTLSKRNYKLSNPQQGSSKQFTSAAYTSIASQQLNSERRQSREIPPVVNSYNIENYSNNYNAMKHTTFSSTLQKLNDELRNPQPSSSKQSTNAAATSIAPQQLNSEKTHQFWEISPAVTFNGIEKNRNNFYSKTHNTPNPTVSNPNNELIHPQPSSSIQFPSAAYTSIAPQQLYSEKRQSREIPPVVNSYNIENNNNSYNAMKHSAFNSTLSNTPNPALSKRHYKLSYPQQGSSKQFTSAAYTSIAPQQLYSEKRQSREIPPVVTSYNIENNSNSYNAMKHSVLNFTLQKLNDELSYPQLNSSKQSTIASEQLNSQKRQSGEIPPVATFDDVQNVNNFIAKKYNANNFIFPNQDNELIHSEPSSFNQSTKAASTTQRDMPNYVEHFKTYTNVTKDYLTVNRSDQATVQPKASNTHNLYERLPDGSTVNMNSTSINYQSGSCLGRAHHSQQSLMPSTLRLPQNSFPTFNIFHASPNFQPNTHKSLLQHVAVHQMLPSKSKSNQYQESNNIPNLNTGENYHRMPSHSKTIPQNATNYVKNCFKRPLEKNPSKAYINASRPPGLCDVLPENIHGSNFPWINCPPAWPPLPPFHNPWNSLSSTHQSSGRADIKRNIPSEKWLDQGARRNGNMFVRSPASDKSERPSEEVVTNKTQPCDLLSSNSALLDALGRAELKRNPSLEKRADHEEQSTKGNMLVFCHSLHKSEHRSEEIMHQTPSLKSCDHSSNSSTSIDNSEQADLKNNLSVEKCHDKEAQSSNREVLIGNTGLDKTEPTLKEILLDENVLPLSNNVEVQKTLLCDDDDTKNLLCLIDSVIDSPL